MGRARQSVLRLVDANANRAMEGLRVCEDIVRFHFEMPSGFRRLRRLRHAVAGALQRLPVTVAEQLRARASGRDPGRRAKATATRSLEQTLLINFQRVKESLRVLEECCRVLAPKRTSAFQRLRFLTYGIERDLLLQLATLRHS